MAIVHFLIMTHGKRFYKWVDLSSTWLRIKDRDHDNS